MGQIVPLAQTIREGIHLSFSQVKSFLTCPKRYAFQYVYGEKREHVPSALVFGKAVHRAAEQFYRHIKEKGEKPDSCGVSQAFRVAFNDELESAAAEAPVTFKNGDSIPEMEKLGLELVRVLYDESRPHNILGVELPFSIPLPNRPERFVGFFDLVEQEDSGDIVWVELKTAARRWSDSQLDWDLQSSAYCHVLKVLGLVNGENPVVRHDILLKSGKKPALERYYSEKSDLQRSLAVRTACDVGAAIESSLGSGVFHRNPSPMNCPDCPFRRRCMSSL